MNAYDEIYQQLLPRLKTCDLKKHAENLGLDYQNSEIKVDFMGEIFTVTNEELFLIPKTATLIMSPLPLPIMFYRKGKASLRKTLSPAHHLANTMTGMFDKTRITEPILIATQGDYKVFFSGCRQSERKIYWTKKRAVIFGFLILSLKSPLALLLLRPMMNSLQNY